MKPCKCLLCKEEFDEPDFDHVYVGEFWGQPVYEEIMICPFCHSDNVVDLEYDDEEVYEVEYDED